MDVTVCGSGPVGPFLGARDIFETERDLDRAVTVEIVPDPNERTRVGHGETEHRLTISRKAATSAMARELALHEYAHMHHHEQGHPSHTQSTKEAIFLGLAGQTVEQRKLTHCYQIANHMKDIYADDVWLELAPADKLVAFLESSLARAVADQPYPATWDNVTATAEPSRTDPTQGSPARIGSRADPDITAVNAAFALGLVERHDLVGGSHPIYDLAHAAAADAPGVSFETFRERFRSLAAHPDESEYRKELVEMTRTYAGSGEQAAD
jgi:hypothetical protein